MAGLVVGPGYELSIAGGQRVARNPQDRWVLVVENRVLVVTTDGGVFGHEISNNTVGPAFAFGT